MINPLALALQQFNGLIDRLNDRLTSYRLMLYFLLTLVLWATLGSFFHKVPYNWHEILVSAGWLVLVCWVTNKLLARFLDIPANKESDLISGLILALILQPPQDLHSFVVAAAAGVAAMASKYLIVLRRTHIFNPAAAGAFIAGEVFNYDAVWWVGTKFITPVVVIGGLLVLRKMKRFRMAATFLLVFIGYQLFGNSSGVSLHFVWLALISTQVLFFAVVMLTEPQTSPTTFNRYIPYAVLVAVLYSAVRLKLSPEEALLFGNIFTLVAGANRRYKLKFMSRAAIGGEIYSYTFSRPAGLNWQPGQYMEWAIAHNRTDARGNRRYLTISASPTEKELMFTVKHTAKVSSFKQRLDQLKAGDTILASHLAGDFTLPKNPNVKVALLAGGVGITPFRSMIKYLIDQNQTRDIALLYSVTTPAELAFKDLFKKAESVGLKSNFIVGEHLDPDKIRAMLTDYKQRTFYVSGPYGFVQAMEQALLKLDIPLHQIITDYFPGYGG
ncbi:MAG TPA: RnfABCDGE type electron transport complex subunit D [Candidatus Saccharimonadales bacterium]|nr:RnfABCDGE type electron transport complex subunit D [Candidatus Saccharimonadales bacterium]